MVRGSGEWEEERVARVKGGSRDRDKWESCVTATSWESKISNHERGLGTWGWAGLGGETDGMMRTAQCRASVRACVRAPLLELERAAFEGFNATAACGPAREGTGAYAYGSFPPARVASRWRCPVRAVAARMCVSPVRARRSVGRSVARYVLYLIAVIHG
uniref:Uncharacterized protein n=1 Tax=Oryza glumipatula TaxID=40148 RepID=A0A0D9YAD7_9ORYZ